MPAPKKPAVSPRIPARVTASTAAPSNPRTAGARRAAAAARVGGSPSAPRGVEGPDGSTPWMRARGVARATMRRLHAMDTAAATMPPPMPAARASGETCSTSRVVPTASTHHVRSPHMMSSA